mmetsp:Transcript_9466/g.16238  ORF Transcript_9466/g.16238 Transcript_9466/m.16238 type:complete len:81 (+) Transcript_9466:1008-1250(+)
MIFILKELQREIAQVHLWDCPPQLTLASHLKFFTKCFSPSYMCFCPWGGFMVKKMVVLSRMHPLPKLLHVLPGLPCQGVD